MEVNYIHYPQTGWGLREYIATQDGIVICSPRAHQNHLASGLFQKDWQYSCACDYHYHVLFIFMGLSLPLSCIVAYSCACHYHYHVLLFVHVPASPNTIIMYLIYRCVDTRNSHEDKLGHPSTEQAVEEHDEQETHQGCQICRCQFCCLGFILFLFLFFYLCFLKDKSKVRDDF